MSRAVPLEVEGFRFTYAGADAPALDVAAWRAGGEGLEVVTGPARSGVSTFLLALAGAVPDLVPGEVSGEVRVGGAPIRSRPPAVRARTVALLSEDFEAHLLLPRVDLEVAFGLENLGVPRPEIAPRVRDALEEVGLRGFEERDPATLSGGEKQRLALAGALAPGVPVLLLDAPSSELDPEGRRSLRGILAALVLEGRTVVVASRTPEEVATAGRITVLAGGRVSASAPAADVLRARLARDPAAEGVPITGLAEVAGALGLAPGPDEALLEALLAPAGPARVLVEGGKLPAGGARAGRTAPSTGEVLLEARGITKRYPGAGRPALQDFSLALRAGEIVALLGRNGSGKTTLLRHLNGLLRPDAGEILHRGRPARGRAVSSLALEAGVLFQNPDRQLFSETVAREVEAAPLLLGLADARARARRALERAGIEEHAAADPLDLPRALRRRVALACLLALDPPVLALDEPTAGLGPAESAAFFTLLRALAREGKAILLVSHRHEDAADAADRVVVLDSGRRIAEGDVVETLLREDLLESAGLPPTGLLRLAARTGIPEITPGGWIARLQAAGGAR